MASEKKRFPVVFVLAPLVAVLGVAGWVGWGMFREYQRNEAEEIEARKYADLAEAERLKAAQAKANPPKVDQPVVEEEDLANLPKGAKPKPKAVASQSPAQRAFFGFRSAYDKLESANENAVKKFRARRLQLEDQFRDGKPTNEAKFVADCDATKALILEALRSPENQ